MIPKIIHFCWLSGEEYPPLVRRCIKSWKRHLPDYEFKLWDASSFDFDSVPYVKDAFIKRHWAFVSDYIRLYALYNFGGIYLDSDVKVHERFDEWHNLNFFTGIEVRPPKFDKYWIEAAIMGGEKGNPMIREVMSHYETLKPDENGVFQDIAAPDVITPVFMKHYGWERKPGTIDLGNRIVVFGKDKIANDSEYYKKGIVLHHRNNCSWIPENVSRGLLYLFFKKYGWLPYYRRIEKLISHLRKL